MIKKNLLIGAAMLAAVSMTGAGFAEELTENTGTSATTLVQTHTETAEEIVSESVEETVSEADADGESAAAEEDAVDISDPSVPVWQTDIRMGIEKERQLIRESGMSLDEWDASVAEMKEEGLASSFTKEAMMKADPAAKILEKDGQVYYVGKNSAFTPVNNAMDAYRMVYSLVDLLGGSAQTDLRLWSVIRVNETTVYSFQQIAGSEEVLGSTVKIALDGNGRITAVFGSLDPEAEIAEETLVTRKQAEEAVMAHIREESGEEVQVLEGQTHRTIYMPVGMGEALNLDSDDEDPVPNMVLWVVYTENKAKNGEDEAAAAEREAYPYVAHYVKTDGTYVKSLPVKEPGDTDSLDGYRKQDVFAGMTAGTYTGVIRGVNGLERTITVPVMHSEADGRWYLGDLNRRIAVADFAEAAYSEEHDLKLVDTPDNTGWDNEDLYMYFNYIRAWDFYANMGWVGPDGQGTDVVILKDLCTSDGTLYENACSIGKIENWQMFGYCGYSTSGEPLGLPRGLDVMAHEYTHTFTATVMNSNLYENDLGAINEAMSDIMGNLVEYICNDTEDTRWILGENTGIKIRSMSDPRVYQQPEYVWDVFYGPHTDEPATANDRGGVHSNSSLLNRIAALLCLDYGMPLETAVSFWTMTAAGMTPRTDYVQIPALLDWAMQESGNGAFTEGLDKLVGEEKLTQTQLPETLPLGQKLVKLKLPDTEAFNDKNWAMICLQLDTEKAGQVVRAAVETVFHMIADGQNPSEVLLALQGIAADLELEGTKLKLDEAGNDDEITEIIKEMLQEAVSGLVIQNMAWEENGSGEITAILKDYPTFYMLMNVSKSGTQINDMVVLLGNRWISLQSMLDIIGVEENEDAPVDEEVVAERLMVVGEQILEAFTEPAADDREALTEMAGEQTNGAEEEGKGSKIADLVDLGLKIADYYLTDEAERPSLEELLAVPAEAQYLPNAGLEDIQLHIK